MVENAGGHFVLVHVATPLEECERRDLKGLYAKARSGEIPVFTGISSPYEEPEDAAVRIDTTGRTVSERLAEVMPHLPFHWEEQPQPPGVEQQADDSLSQTQPPGVEPRADLLVDPTATTGGRAASEASGQTRPVTATNGRTVNELITGSALAVLIVSFGVGIVVGLTGMGGGALMTPALIFLGRPATAAVANDLVAASVNKTVGASVHWKRGSPNLRLAGLLIVGSVPFALAGGFIVKAVGDTEKQQEFLTTERLCAAVHVATYSLRTNLQLRDVTGGNVMSTDEPRVRVVPTVVVGGIGGLPWGPPRSAPAAIMGSLLLLDPTLSAVRLVGTTLSRLCRWFARRPSATW